MINKEIIYVLTGEVCVGTKDELLRSSAIGSCVVVSVYDTKLQIGGLAHIMLPGKAPENTNYPKTRYAIDAIEDLISKMNSNGSKGRDNILCIVGGGNVLKRENDSIAQNNIDGVLEILKEKSFKITAKSVGGTERRSIMLNNETGCVKYTIGDGAEMILWNNQMKIMND